MNRRRPLGLLLPAAFGALAALLGTALPPVVLPASVGAAVLALGAVALAVRRRTRRTASVAAGALVVLAVLGSVALAEPRRAPPGMTVDRPATLEVRVDQAQALIGSDRSGAMRRRLLLRGAVRRMDDQRGLDAPVVLFASGMARPAPGSVIRVRAVLRRAPPTDQAAFTGEVAGRADVVQRPPVQQAVASRLRARFAAATARLPGDGGALLPGLAIGDVDRVDEDLQQAMRDSSLTHLTAVSGANCAVVIVAVLALGGLLRLPRAVRTIAAGAALAAFVVLVTPQPSVVRAAVMAAVGLGCVLAGRRTAGPSALGLTVAVLLVLDPWIAWSAGFVLSVAATAGLLLLAPALAERLARVMPARAALVLAVPVAAQAACQPVLVLLQPGVPVFGVLANLVAEPAAPVVTVLGLLACLVLPVVPPLGAGLALLAWLPAAWIGVVARTAARLPQLGWPAGVVGAALAGLLLVAGVLALRRRVPRPVRAIGAVAAGCALLVVAGAAAGGAIGRLAGTPTDWTLAACDVGQGDGLVLNGGAGRYAVVDTGPEPEVMARCLDRLGVHRVDLLVLTHWDLDHVGGARALLPKVRAALVGPVDRPAAADLRRDLAAHAAVQQARRGDVAHVGRLRLEVLWPTEPLGATEPGNAASITLLVTGGPRLLLTGDLGRESQEAVLAAGPLPAVDVVKVAHHGSADQSPAFYAAAGASLGVISDGAGNDYGHPTRSLLHLLRSDGTNAVRTDQSGLVLIGMRDGRLRLWTERPVTAAVWAPAK